MRFDLEDKKKINLICDLMKALTSARSSVMFVWHRIEGWAVLQNQDYLDNLDSSNMVNLCQVKSHFFSHISPEGRENICFELDVTNYARVLRSVKNEIKRMVWSAQVNEKQPNDNSQNNSDSRGVLRLSVLLEDGQLEVEREIFIISRTNPMSYFRVFKDFNEEKTQYLEIKQQHMKQLRELRKNECVFFKFFDQFVTVYNQEDENNIAIRKNALQNYDYATLLNNLNGKNRLTIPPNFLVPQVLLGIKLKDPIQLFISNDYIDDHISVSLRTKNDSFTFISQFKSIIEKDEDDYDYQHNPFDANRIKANGGNTIASHIINQQQRGIAQTHNNNQQRQDNSRESQEQQSYVSVESHIQGLTNNMHLADCYGSNNNTNVNTSDYENDHIQQQQMRSKHEDSSPEARQQNDNQYKKNITNKNNNNNYNEFKQPEMKQNNKQGQQQQQQQQMLLLNQSALSNQILSVSSTQLSGTDLNASYHPYKQNLNSSNNNQSVQNMLAFNNQNQIQQNTSNKRKNEQINDFSNVQIFREQTNKRIKESNFTELHAPPNHNNNQYFQQPSSSSSGSFINPLISQEKAENSFANFMNQNMKASDFSIFKSSSSSVPAIQFQPQNLQDRRQLLLQQQQQQQNQQGNQTDSKQKKYTFLKF